MMSDRNSNVPPSSDGRTSELQGNSRDIHQAPICYRMHPEKVMLGEQETCIETGHCSRPAATPSEHRTGGQSAASNGNSFTGNTMPPCLLSRQQHSVIDIGGAHRVALMITPETRGAAIDQTWEVISTIRVILNQQAVSMKLVQQTVFVRCAEDISAIRRLYEAYFGNETPGTNYIVQPPCAGQALAVEAWAIGGEGVNVTFQGGDVVTVDYDDLRWIYLSGISPMLPISSAYEQSQYCFAELARRLHRVGAGFTDVPRVWLYQGGITHLENGIERYRELNRSRTDYFDSLTDIDSMKCEQGHVIYPASTGIGTGGQSLVLSAMAMRTDRTDVRLVALENPSQVSAFDYERKFSHKSPKFSRAMAVVTGDYVTTWISGTASILDAESVHLGDIEKQTQQTIDNIECLISEGNLSRHGFNGCGSSLKELAKVRVYVKRAEDYEACRAVCESRFGELPTVYALADVCRPELLVEIEGVAFTKVQSEVVTP